MLNLLADYVTQHSDTEIPVHNDLLIKSHQAFKSNLLFFKNFHPDVFDLVINHPALNYSVFCSKHGELNIVEGESGRVLYSANPKVEVQREVSSFCERSPVIYLTSSDGLEQLKPIKQGAVILMYGIGAGWHIEYLLRQTKPAVLVLYEAELDLFVSSLQTADWERIFAIAAECKTQISIQAGNSGSSITADLAELIQLLPELKEVYLYRHLAHSVSDEVFEYLRRYSGKPEKLLQNKHQFVGFHEDELFVGERPAGVLANEKFSKLKKNDIYYKNIAALKKFYPNLHHVFSNYQPKHWYPVEVNGLANLWCETRSVFLYENEFEQSQKIIDSFLKAPNENPVILNQGGIWKYRNYVHFTAVRKLQPILTSLKPRELDKETEVENLILLGIGLGRHLTLLLEQREVKNLFIFEPNTDFFYASLFVTDWSRVLEATVSGQRLYFNIGGSGEEYFNDIMQQYYELGAYATANSQIVSAFLTPRMKTALKKMQSQLKVIVASGEVFDHVRYGISHTLHSLVSGHRFLKKQRHYDDLKQIQGIPVFVVGNGPSLDDSYSYIKKYRSQVIVVSCGTALRSLYRLGIKPDFHAEIEQNRATFNWVSQVKDNEWLKSISLLSINGIHPETAALFKNVYLAFKEGESPTKFFRDVLEKNHFHTAILKYSYPTVSNLVVDFFSELGFKQLYFFGVDLGYVDPENHHSKHSAYYKESGHGVIDAKSRFTFGMNVQGNFRQQVQTKPEFDFSRNVLEMTIAHSGNDIDYYNCSDGARILGTVPLHPENILITPSTRLEHGHFFSFFDKLFYHEELMPQSKDFLNVIQKTSITETITELLNLSHDVSSYDEAKQLINEQWQHILSFYKDENKLPFYLLHGSVIYMLSVLTRVIPLSSGYSFKEDLKTFNNVLQIWRDYLIQANTEFKTSTLSYCDVDLSVMFNA